MSTETDPQHEAESANVEVKISFRVMGTDLEPAEVSRLLEMEPTKAHARGGANLGQSGRRYSDFSEGLWAWSPDLSLSAPLAAHLRVLIEVLEPKAAAVRRLKKMGLRLDLFVGIFGAEGNFALLLEHDLLMRLGGLGVDLVFDVYALPSEVDWSSANSA